jgi:hypothetical protein
MLDDSRILLNALSKAHQRFERREEVAYEGCAHQLCRMYNAFEQMGLRVAKAFENHIDDERGWHTALLTRLSIAIGGVRPAFIPVDLKSPLQELKGFRHVFVHAYDLDLDPEKLALLLKYAGRVAERFPALVESFISEAARQHGLDKTP